MNILLSFRILGDLLASSWLLGLGVSLITVCIETGEMKAPIIMLCIMPFVLGLVYLIRLVIYTTLQRKLIEHSKFKGLLSMILCALYLMFMYIDPEQIYVNRTLAWFIFVQILMCGVNVKGDEKDE